MKRTVTSVLLIGMALCATCIAQQKTKTPPNPATVSTQHAKPALVDLKPTIDNGQANKATISTRTVEGKDWLLFSLKKGSEMLYCGGMWILPGTPSGGMFTDQRGDHYAYASDGLYMGEHLQLLPGSVSIDKFNSEGSVPGYTGMLDFSGSVYTFAGDVDLLGYAFSSDKVNPLVFKLVKNVGAIYLSGKGTVTTPGGKKIVYP